MKSLFSLLSTFLTGSIFAMVAIWGIKTTTPVVSNMRPVAWKINHNNIRAEFIGTKNKSECYPVEGSEAGYIKHDGRWDKVKFRFDHDEGTKYSTRPAKFQSFGWWEWDNKGKIATHVLMRMDHICGNDTATTPSEFGPFEIPKNQKVNYERYI